MADILLAYGTLRPGKESTVQVPGELFDLGWFPGIILGGPSTVICEPLEVKDWELYDRYEGYHPTNPEDSLYIRRYLKEFDGYIYEYNRPVEERKVIESGDWLKYKPMSTVRRQVRP